MLVAQLCLTACDPMVTPQLVTCQAPQSMESSGQKYGSGLPIPSPGNLPNSGINLRSPTLQADSLLFEPPGKPHSDI